MANIISSIFSILNSNSHEFEQIIIHSRENFPAYFSLSMTLKEIDAITTFFFDLLPYNKRKAALTADELQYFHILMEKAPFFPSYRELNCKYPQLSDSVYQKITQHLRTHMFLSFFEIMPDSAQNNEHFDSFSSIHQILLMDEVKTISILYSALQKLGEILTSYQKPTFTSSDIRLLIGSLFLYPRQVFRFLLEFLFLFWWFFSHLHPPAGQSAPEKNDNLVTREPSNVGYYSSNSASSEQHRDLHLTANELKIQLVNFFQLPEVQTYLNKYRIQPCSKCNLRFLDFFVRLGILSRPAERSPYSLNGKRILHFGYELHKIGAILHLFLSLHANQLYLPSFCFRVLLEASSYMVIAPIHRDFSTIRQHFRILSLPRRILKMAVPYTLLVEDNRVRNEIYNLITHAQSHALVFFVPTSSTPQAREDHQAIVAFHEFSKNGTSEPRAIAKVPLQLHFSLPTLLMLDDQITLFSPFNHNGYTSAFFVILSTDAQLLNLMKEQFQEVWDRAVDYHEIQPALESLYKFLSSSRVRSHLPETDPYFSILVKYNLVSSDGTVTEFGKRFIELMTY